MITPEKLNESIERIRNEKGEGKTQFYTNSGAGRSFSDNLKKGQMPSFDKVCMIADYAGVSLDSIIGRAAENIGAASSTVKRVFSDGSESFGWQYENTLKPIADAVLGIYGPSEAATADEADALKAIIDYKSEKISELAAQLERCEESYRRRIEFLKDQIALKDERIDRRDATMERLLAVILEREKYGGVCSVCIARNKAERSADLSQKEPDGRSGADCI